MLIPGPLDSFPLTQPTCWPTVFCLRLLLFDHHFISAGYEHVLGCRILCMGGATVLGSVLSNYPPKKTEVKFGLLICGRNASMS